VRLEISDTGVGIAQDVLPRVFDPFFTTKPTGTGLGLAVVKRIVEAHRGDLKIDSTPGEGCKVVIELPREVPRVHVAT
jgi:signal transduction histidine kinase